MKQTTNLGLWKPDPEDYAKIETLNENADKIDDAVGRMQKANFSNPNLLDNWYFADPINQRGKTEYTSSEGVCIDRWKYSSAQQVIKVTENGTVVNFHPTSNQTTFSQFVDDFQELAGKTVTVSLLLSATAACKIVIRANGSNTTRGDSPYATDGLVSVTYTLPDELTKLEVYMVTSSSTGCAMTPVAVKLELGSVQTLARQDANGNWVLNDPPPDKGMELLKCVQSTANPNDGYANKTILHTGNKPSGSYTGNGSTAYRQIDTGGMGSLCLITRGGAGMFWALASVRGTIISDGTTITAATTFILDAAGNIQMMTSHAALNENGVEYTYHIL